MCVCIYIHLFIYAYIYQVTLSVVNTRSMSPAIQPRDIILVEKVTPIVKRLFQVPVAGAGDVIFFREPSSMRRYIEAEGLPAVGDALLVKRVSDVRAVSEKTDNSGVVCIYFLLYVLL